MKQVWSGMRKITGLERMGSSLPDGDRDIANNFNLFVFLNRFDTSLSTILPQTAPMASTLLPITPPQSVPF